MMNAVDALLDRCDSMADSWILATEATLSEEVVPSERNYAIQRVSDTTMDSVYTVRAACDVVGERPIWLDKVVDDLNELAKLGEDWDSYGSERIPKVLIDEAKKFVTSLEFEEIGAPFVVPISGGGIQLEWHKGTHELEIEFIDVNRIAYLKVVEDAPVEEGTFVADDTHMSRALVRWLKTG